VRPVGGGVRILPSAGQPATDAPVELKHIKYEPLYLPDKGTAFCALLPSAHHTQLLALSNLLLGPVHSYYDRELLGALCAHLRPQDLAEVLKYPFCTGEAEQIVLLQLEAKTSRDFGGNVWKFAEQADALGIKDIGSPAQRPSAQEALFLLPSGSFVSP
jgi:hypothetical protein